MKPPVILLLVLLNLLGAQVTGLAGWDIFIDPGHSQTENMGVNGYSEAEEVLRVAIQLKDILMTQTDIDTVWLSRTNDQQSVSLTQRTDYANSLGASWYHSIHSDAGAANNNSTLLLWGQLYNGEPDPPVGGETMSGYMIDILTRGMRIPTTGSWGDCSFYTWSTWCQTSGGPYLHVNRATNMPSELSEEGHHTNPAQNQLDMNAEYKRLLAYTFFWSILEYHGIPRPYVGMLTGVVRDLETGIPINGAEINVDGQSYTTDTYASLFHNYTSNPDALHNGFYFFENLPDSTLPVIISAEGYYPDTLTVEISDTFFTFLDPQLLSSMPPAVVGSSPVEGDGAYPAWYPVAIDFSRSMDAASVAAAMEFDPALTGTYSSENDDHRILFHPDSIEYLTGYTLTLHGTCQDTYGHLLDGDGDGQPGGDFILNFTTSGSDIAAPLIQSAYPPMTSNGIELNPIVKITYNEVIGNPEIIPTVFRLERFATSTDVAVQIADYTVYDQTVVCLFPQSNLYPGEVYITRINPGLADLFGNTVAGWNSTSFQTGNLGSEVTLIDDFETGVLSNWWDPAQSGSTTGTIGESTGLFTNDSILNLLSPGELSMELQYGWEPGAGEWLIREYLGSGPPRNVYFDDSYNLEVYLFGDGSGNLFRFCVDDNQPSSDAEDHEVSPWYVVNWRGWKRVTWDLDTDGTGSWIGDGTLNGSMRFDSIQLSYAPGNPNTGFFIFDDLGVSQAVALGTNDAEPAIPSNLSLEQNYPNPFNPVTTIRYSIPEPGLVSLTIHSLSGSEVISLVNGYQDRGVYLKQWQGRNQSGMIVPSGLYFYTLKAGGEALTRRLLFLK